MEETVVAKRPREEEPHVLKEEDAMIDCEESSSKRHKPYNYILSLLESEELLEDSTQEDLSPLITTLQHELSTSPSESDESHHHVHTLLTPSQNNNAQHNNLTTSTTTSSTLEDCSSTSTTTLATATHSSSNGVLEEDDKERVMRHLLEASDDELGIPNRSVELEGSSSLEDFGEDGFSGNNGDMFSSLCDANGLLLWELEDETANYYALLQSELFL